MSSSYRNLALCFILVAKFYLIVATSNGYAYLPDNEIGQYMCTTVNYKNEKPNEQNAWTSCSANCPEKSSSNQESNYPGYPRIFVDLRKSGETFRLEECEDVQSVKCQTISGPDLECYKGDCQEMSGLFECTTNPTFNIVKDSTYGAICRDITSALKCEAEEYEPAVSCHKVKNCLHLNGKYKCENGECEKLVEPYKCERICDGALEIRDKEKLVIVRQLDGMFSATCARMFDPTNGTWLPDLANVEPDSKIPNFLVFCSDIQQWEDGENRYDFLDCFNGTKVEPGYFGGENVDIATLTKAHGVLMAEAIEAGAIDKFIGPTEASLMIGSNAKLYINEEGCTTSGEECKDFITKYGLSYAIGNDYLFQLGFKCNYNSSESPNSAVKLTNHFPFFILIAFSLI